MKRFGDGVSGWNVTGSIRRLRPSLLNMLAARLVPILPRVPAAAIRVGSSPIHRSMLAMASLSEGANGLFGSCYKLPFQCRVGFWQFVQYLLA